MGPPARDAGRDLDLHLVQVVEDDPTKVCTTYWNNMAGCKDTELDQNVGEGALLGRSSSSLAETITVHNLAAKSQHRFMVFVDDNTATGADLGQVQPQITMTKGSVIVTDQMPQLPMWKEGSRFWLAGAIEVSNVSFSFVCNPSCFPGGWNQFPFCFCQQLVRGDTEQQAWNHN